MTTRTGRVRALNDQLRTASQGGRVVVTQGVNALDGQNRAAVMTAARDFDQFIPDNAPGGGHDLGPLTVSGVGSQSETGRSQRAVSRPARAPIRVARSAGSGPMRRVAQRRGNDCGVACVAMLAKVPYRRACNAVFGDERATYTSAHQLRKALRAFGVDLASHARRFPKRSIILANGPIGDALVKANVRSDGSWHWVVWDGSRRKVLDPKRSPYKRLRLHSYYTVVRH